MFLFLYKFINKLLPFKLGKFSEKWEISYTLKKC